MEDFHPRGGVAGNFHSSVIHQVHRVQRIHGISAYNPWTTVCKGFFGNEQIVTSD